MILLNKEQKIKVITDVQKGIITKNVVQFLGAVIFLEPDKFTINNICFAKNEYFEIIEYLKSINSAVISFIEFKQY